MGVEAVQRIESFIVKSSAPKTIQQASTMRKMIFMLAEEMSDILTCLENHIEKMRHLSEMPEKQQKDAVGESLSLWAPIAGRLGISAIKDELEDVSLKFNNPDVYEQIKQIVSLKKQERSQYLENAQKEIYRAAERNGLNITVQSRAKHFWSIYQKMKKRNKAADELYDLMALRILCQNSDECYRLIGLVHTLWKPVDKRFKDYIAVPKSNGYQSLHTTVMCDSFPLEIQIRTHNMHEVAEHGVAGHWLYKQRAGTASVADAGITDKLTDLYQKDDGDRFMNEVKAEMLGSAILVFTPQGDVIQLPKNATAVDFAYYIHSKIGEKTVGAKADGHIIPLSTPLETAQTIEILTSPQAHPTANQLELAKTTRARSKIRHWLTVNDELFKEQKEAVLPAEKLLEQRAAAQKIAEIKRLKRQKERETAQLFKIRIDDSSNYVVSFANCCNPAYGDAVIGYVSRGRGIIVHKTTCPNLPHIAEIDKRSVTVVWD